MSDQKIKQLILSEGKARTFELENGEIVKRDGGSVSWRNNNPGNLKFEFDGSADRTVHNNRSKAQALARARKSYDGVVALDQWGNAVFETYEAGRAAKLQLLQRKYDEKNVEAMLQSYSTADYTGSTHHRAQADYIYREGDRQGLNLRNKTIGEMSDVELAAMADGIKGFEGWKVGKTSIVQPQLAQGSPVTGVQQRIAVSPHDNGLGVEMRHGVRGDDVQALQKLLSRLGYCGVNERPLKVDGDFGPNTTHAIKSFQRAHHLKVDGIAGKDTQAALTDARHAPLLSEATHPRHQIYVQILHGIHRLPTGTYRDEQERINAAVALTISAGVEGMRKIDHVVLGLNGANLFAVQGRMDDPAHRRVYIDHQQAMSRSVDHATTALQASQMRMHPVQSQVERTAVQGIDR